MLPLGSSRIFFPSSNWFFLLVLIYFLLVSGLPVEAQALTKKNAAATGQTVIPLTEKMRASPWSKVTGFRSAKFGMNEKSVFRAIAKDFKLDKSKVKKIKHPTEQTTALQIKVPDLFSTGGTAVVAYILGHKSKKLIQINVSWGKGVSEKVDGEGVVLTANALRDHFVKKRYKEKDLVINGKMSENSTMVFRGRDKEDRMIIVILITPGRQEEGETVEEAMNKISLQLSYLVDPDNPDVRSIKVKEGEF